MRFQFSDRGNQIRSERASQDETAHERNRGETYPSVSIRLKLRLHRSAMDFKWRPRVMRQFVTAEEATHQCAIFKQERMSAFSAGTSDIDESQFLSASNQDAARLY